MNKPIDWESRDSDYILGHKMFRSHVGKIGFFVMFDYPKHIRQWILLMNIDNFPDPWLVGIFESPNDAMKYAEDIISSIKEEDK